jgi:hypothetical protein
VPLFFWRKLLSDTILSFLSAMLVYCLQVVMRDPQVAADGFTYEADALRYWLDSGHDTSPVTNKTLSNRDTIPNHALRSAIQEYLRQNKLQKLFSQG